MFNMVKVATLEQRIEHLEFLICKGNHSWVKGSPVVVAQYSETMTTNYVCERCGAKMTTEERIKL